MNATKKVAIRFLSLLVVLFLAGAIVCFPAKAATVLETV